MGIGRRIFCLSTLAIQAGLLTADDAEPVRLAVRVYDYVALPAFELENAMAVAQRIFRTAGISLSWANCTVTLKSGQAVPGCEGLLGPSTVILNIVRRPPENCGYESIGCALPDSHGGMGVVAYVFAQRLEASVLMGGAGRFRLLGSAMAHEFGHLLLGPGAHSATGIMRPNWSPQQMSATPGSAIFSDEQARLMRSRLEAGFQEIVDHP